MNARPPAPKAVSSIRQKWPVFKRFVSSGWRDPVATCGALWSPEALASYIFIYSGIIKMP